MADQVSTRRATTGQQPKHAVTGTSNSTTAHSSHSTHNAITITSDTMASRRYAKRLRYEGKITQHEYDTLIILIKYDINTIDSKEPLAYSLDNSISARAADSIAAVLNTAELLEAILLSVPAADLILNIPLVCKGFQQAPQASSELKRKTHRLPTTSSTGSFQCFPVNVPGFQLGSAYFNSDFVDVYIRPREIKKHLKRSAKFRQYQVGRPVGTSLVLRLFQHQVDKNIEHWTQWLWPRDWVFYRKEGVTLGDVLDIVGRDKMRTLDLMFRLYRDPPSSGQSSPNHRKWMAGEEMVYER